MNSLHQLPSGLFGSVEAVASLESAPKSRLLVVSDTHGHYDLFEAIVSQFGPECDALLFAGDGMWDVIQYLENAWLDDRLRSALPSVLAFVAGNGDGDQYRISLPESEPDFPGGSVPGGSAPGAPVQVLPRQIIRASGTSIVLVHGHRHSVEFGFDMLVESARAQECSVCVFGHTHVPYAEEFAHITLVNPGSPARPRGQSLPGFGILELEAAAARPHVEFIVVRDRLRGGYAFDTTYMA